MITEKNAELLKLFASWTRALKVSYAWHQVMDNSGVRCHFHSSTSLRENYDAASKSRPSLDIFVVQAETRASWASPFDARTEKAVYLTNVSQNSSLLMSYVAFSVKKYQPTWWYLRTCRFIGACQQIRKDCIKGSWI